MFVKSLKKVNNLLKKNKNLVLIGLVVIALVVLFLKRDLLMNVFAKEEDDVEKENTVNSLADVVSTTEEEEEIKKELNNVLNNAVVNNEKAKNVQENFNIADCLAAGGDYESCK